MRNEKRQNLEFDDILIFLIQAENNAGQNFELDYIFLEIQTGKIRRAASNLIVKILKLNQRTIKYNS